MRIGYARVSTRDQDVAMQIKALEDAGCDQIFTETTSGSPPIAPSSAERSVISGRVTPRSFGGWTGSAGPSRTWSR